MVYATHAQHPTAPVADLGGLQGFHGTPFLVLVVAENHRNLKPTARSAGSGNQSKY